MTYAKAIGPSSSWPLIPFKELMEIPLKNGLTRPTKVRGKGVKMINMGELFANRIIRDIPMSRVPMTPKEKEDFSIESGDLLFARQSLVLSGVGKCAIFIGDEKEVTFEGHLIRARIKRPNSPLFYFYFFNSQQGRSLIQSYSEQVAASGIRGSDLKEIKVPFPPSVEQNNIASVLYNLDRRIYLNSKLNAVTEAISKNLFKHWFIDFEFPDENGQPYKSSGGEMVDSEIGEIPKNWSIKKLDGIANFLNGLALQKYPAIDEEDYLPVIKIKEMNSGISESSDKASPNIPSEYIVENGDILFAWSGSLGVSIWCNGKGALNQHLFKVSSKKYPKWLYYQWLMHYLPGFIEIARDKATTMGHIQRHHLSESIVAVPDPNTLEMMDKIFNPMIQKIINLKVENGNLTKTRDLLLPKLISGKIRVPVEDTNV